jgi:DNA-binding NtrC family response regulator
MLKVLVIDDEAMVRKIVRKMLERSGHKVVEAENGKLGIELLTSDAFDLVITDIIMPEMEGIETLINVKRQRPDTQVIAMSGGGRTGNVDFLQTAQKLGAAAILHKPFTMNSLSAAVEEACGKVLTAAAS